VRVLVATGGHDFEADAFDELLCGLAGIETTHAGWPAVDDIVSRSSSDDFAAFLFYDFGQEFSDGARSALVRALHGGTGLVVLHHAIYNHLAWPKWAELVGGRWLPHEFEVDGAHYGPSTATLDQMLTIRASDDQHPITAGVCEFTLHDEVYGSYYVAPTVHPLLATDHPLSERLVGWSNERQGRRTVYLQPGHGPETFWSAAFRTLLARSLSWSAGDL
jgi:type 1 glutamine amidotransferase